MKRLASGSGRAVLRALLRQHGYRVPSGSADRFVDRVRRLPLPGRVRSVIAPLLAVTGPLNQQLAYSDIDRADAMARATRFARRHSRRHERRQH